MNLLWDKIVSQYIKCPCGTVNFVPTENGPKFSAPRKVSPTMVQVPGSYNQPAPFSPSVPPIHIQATTQGMIVSVNGFNYLIPQVFQSPKLQVFTFPSNIKQPQMPAPTHGGHIAYQSQAVPMNYPNYPVNYQVPPNQNQQFYQAQNPQRGPPVQTRPVQNNAPDQNQRQERPLRNDPAPVSKKGPDLPKEIPIDEVCLAEPLDDVDLSFGDVDQKMSNLSISSASKNEKEYAKNI